MLTRTASGRTVVDMSDMRTTEKAKPLPSSEAVASRLRMLLRQAEVEHIGYQFNVKPAHRTLPRGASISAPVTDRARVTSWAEGLFPLLPWMCTMETVTETGTIWIKPC